MNKTTHAMPFRLGLTGGIGSGKSTVARLLVRHGATLVDADAIARATTAPGGAAMPEIAASFGPALITADGALNRDAMRQLAFNDADARHRLESIIHPLVGAEALRQAQASTAPCVVFDIPLLAESRYWRQRLHRVLVVDCSSETQIRRVMARNGLARDAVEKIIQAQANRFTRLACADAVLWNDTDTLQPLQTNVAGLAAGFGLSLLPE